jgi:thiol-disulfide isomerase/thioredoxin
MTRRRPAFPRSPHRREVLGRLAGLGALAAIAPMASAEAATPTALGSTVPWPTIRLLSGATLEPAALAGQAVIVVFFSTDCPFCARHNVHVDKLARASAKLPLRIVMAARDRDPEVVRHYLRQRDFQLDVTLQDAPALQAVLSARRVIPLTCAVDRQGRLREVIPGEMFEEDVLELSKWAQTT